MSRERVGPFEDSPWEKRITELREWARSAGWSAGFIEGCAERFPLGQAAGLKAALFKLVARTGLALGEEERARIDECNDPAVLDRWLDNAFGAKTAADLFQ